jgi:Transcription elongation factor, GreA/GreB, C-term
MGEHNIIEYYPALITTQTQWQVPPQNDAEQCQKDDLIPAEHQDAVFKATQTIHSCMQNIARNVFMAGQELISVKQLVGHGCFGKWIKREFPDCERLAQHWMNVYQRMGDKADLFVQVKSTVLYHLAMPSTPDEVIRIVEQKLKSGEKMTVKKVQSLITAHKAPQMNQAETPWADFTTSHHQATVAINLQKALLDALQLLGNQRVHDCESVLGRQSGRNLRQIRVTLTELISQLEHYEHVSQGTLATDTTGFAWYPVHDEWTLIDIQPGDRQHSIPQLPVLSKVVHTIGGSISPAIKVAPGCTVHVHDMSLDQEMQYTLVEEMGAPDQGRINIRSAVGKALLGKSEGDVVTVDTPAGTVDITIVRIQFPEQPLFSSRTETF